MAVYLISYDLRSPGQDYQKLFSVIQSFGSWWHGLESTWMVATTLSAVDVGNRIWAAMDKNDSLLVTPVMPGAAWAGFSGDCLEWLKRNL